ncbi:hypothetical protein SAMN05443668_102726 [Cryptosporangium aurantiacum]|uniref:Uncharacterized protein n=1 Tax=Cryptosporangium aurantiacum TaxID=134849 RepID=A0A1M7NMC8_9ACTN|nr:hypothetical protein SAMN05443668_102726 [Cryptosporangium aurantiacum]
MAAETCKKCKGRGATAHSAGGSGYTYKRCASCGGSGVAR